MNFLNRIALALIIFVLVFAGISFACTIEVNNMDTKVRESGSYSSSIDAQMGSKIDIQVTFDVSDYFGSDCPAQIDAEAVISRYNDNDNNWEYYKTSEIKSDTLDEDHYSFTWSDEFTISSNSKYTEYKIEGIALDDGNTLDSDTARIYVVDNSCDSIVLNVSNINVDESETTTKYFTIENNSGLDFEISDVSVTFDSSILHLDDLSYDDTVSANSDETVDVSIRAEDVSEDYDTSGTFEVSGYLGSEYCSMTEIGSEDFDITVQETGSSGNNYYSTTEDCHDIEILTRDFVMDETTNSKIAFSLKNNTTKRFEVTGVEVTSSGLDLSNYYNEKYLFSGQVSDIILSATAPAVTQDKTYNNTIKVKGMFSDGKACSFNDIYSKTFNTTINDVASYSTPTTTTCGALTISAPSYVSVENYGTFSLTIVNNTNKRADIYVEGSVDAQPTLISIPTATSITREVSFGINTPTGEINFRPVVEGCTINSTRVGITNTASGSIKNTSISTTVSKDENTGALTLSITIENNANKVFNGIVEATAPGYTSVDKAISASPGKNVLEITLIPNGETKQGKGIVTFKANGEEINTQFDTQSNSGVFAGLFAFSPISGTLGILLIIIIIVLVIATVIMSRTPRKEDTDQKWVENKQ